MSESFSIRYLDIINTNNNVCEIEIYANELENKIRQLSNNNIHSDYLYNNEFFLIDVFNNNHLFNNITLNKFRKYLNYICNNIFNDFSNMVIYGWSVFHIINNNNQSYEKFNNLSTNFNFFLDIAFYDTDKTYFIKQINKIIENIETDVILFKDDNYIYIISEYPIKKIRIKCTIFKSIVDILININIDCNCFLYDGTSIYTIVRGFMSFRDKLNTLQFDYNNDTIIELLLYKLYGIDIELLRDGLTNPDFWLGRLGLLRITNNGIEDIMRMYINNHLCDIINDDIYINKTLTETLLTQIPWDFSWTHENFLDKITQKIPLVFSPVTKSG